MIIKKNVLRLFMFYAYFQASGSTLTQQLSQYVAGLLGPFCFNFTVDIFPPSPRTPVFLGGKTFLVLYVYVPVRVCRKAPPLE